MGVLMIQVVTLRWHSPVLHAALAEWWSSRDVAREMGARPINDHLCTWVVAFLDGEVAGMACVRDQEWRSAYVAPRLRGRGVYHALCAARVELAPGTIRTTANGRSAPILRSMGFVDVRRRGSFFVLRREA